LRGRLDSGKLGGGSEEASRHLQERSVGRTSRPGGEICGWLFDENGQEVKTDITAIGLGFKGLKAIAVDARRQVILVAGGDRRRFVPLRAALHARLASILVSDTITARFLVDEKQPRIPLT
jgi:DNA-binding transcriptional regulator LsrR (DeoR family)